MAVDITGVGITGIRHHGRGHHIIAAGITAAGITGSRHYGGGHHGRPASQLWASWVAGIVVLGITVVKHHGWQALWWWASQAAGILSFELKMSEKRTGGAFPL